VELKGIVHAMLTFRPTKMNYFIIYSSLSCSKPIWLSFFCWTQKMF